METAFSNVELEQGILGAMLLEPRTLDTIGDILVADDFSEALHQKFFSTLLGVHAEGRRVDLKLAISALGGLANAEVVKGMTAAQYAARLAAATPTTVGAGDYAVMVRDLADKRRIADVAATLTQGLASDFPVKDVAGAGMDLLDGLVSSRAGPGSSQSSVADAAERAVDRMSDGMQNPGRIRGLSSGLRDLDRMTGGFHGGDLVVLAARPSMGKSAVAVSVAVNLATAGHAVVFFSLEMSDTALANRVLADRCFDHRDRIEYFAIDAGHLSDAQAERVVDASRALRDVPLLIEPQSALTVSQIASRSRRHLQRLERQGKRLGAIVVDHIHITRPSERYRGHRTGEITEISGALKALAKDLNVPVIALAQLSRQIESRDDKRPQMSDLRDSGSIEQDADTIIFLYREAYYLERATCSDSLEEEKRTARLFEVRNSLEAIIAKQRNGPIGPVHLFFDAGCNAVRNAEGRR